MKWLWELRTNDLILGGSWTRDSDELSFQPLSWACVTIIEPRGVLQEKAMLAMELRAVFGGTTEIVV